MSPAPYLVRSLATLRAEFNAVSPHRDKGADGWIGDPDHQARTSDHNPRSNGAVLAIDIDSTGPWPAADWFDEAIHALVVRERDRWLSPTEVCRLEYVIWNRQIAARTIDNFRWREYVGSDDPHIDHAHFSGRHDLAGINLTAPWGLLEDTMALADDKITLTADTAKELGRKAGEQMTAATLLQLAVIFGARADDHASAADDKVAVTQAQIAKLSSDVATLKASQGTGIDLDLLADKILDRAAARFTA